MKHPPFFMKQVLLTFFSFWLLSCNNQSGQPDISGTTIHGNATDTIVTHSTPILLAGCYQMLHKKDIGTMQLSVSDSTVTGKLNYILYKKDSNAGNVKGVIRDSSIIADYTFESEGMLSVRQVIFKIYPGKLVQANGEIEERNGKQFFKDLQHLYYDTSFSFYKTLCK